MRNPSSIPNPLCSSSLSLLPNPLNPDSTSILPDSGCTEEKATTTNREEDDGGVQEDGEIGNRNRRTSEAIAG
jgi:hypothetical protein